MAKQTKNDIFTRFTSTVSSELGRPWVFIIAIGLLLVWGVSGPFLGFSDTWQLVINTSTTIITFLMVFIIQNTQNRDNLAINIKLDAIMDALDVSEAELFKAEDQNDKDLEKKKLKLQKKMPTPPSRSNSRSAAKKSSK